MARGTHREYISSFLVGSVESNIMVSHLPFADDSLIFCNSELSQIVSLRRVFTWFEAVFGLRVNLHKSEIVLVGAIPNLEELMDVMGCHLSALPMTYLRLPLGAKSNSTMIWNPVIKKMERRLAGWKCLYLSKGAKLTLLKSTLSNFPTYFFIPIPSPIWGGSSFTEVRKGLSLGRAGRSA